MEENKETPGAQFTTTSDIMASAAPEDLPENREGLAASGTRGETRDTGGRPGTRGETRDTGGRHRDTGTRHRHGRIP
ncbi:hypothetical protein OYC64_015000 [Pagothenia borchgrevinki]|uniref:Uncharacterized protein n=1 Tax=Pagothenia borchgrevinki TaxID=8213 RepID=A0ABD2H2C6_PAGBO